MVRLSENLTVKAGGVKRNSRPERDEQPQLAAQQWRPNWFSVTSEI